MKRKFTQGIAVSALFFSFIALTFADLCDQDCTSDCTGNWYLEAQGGLLHRRNLVTGDKPAVGFNSTIKHKLGGTAGLEFGFMPNDYWHVGLGVDWRRSPGKTIGNPGIPLPGNKIEDKGYMQNIAVMLNAYYDWWFMDCMSLSFGGGVGAAHTRLLVNASVGGMNYQLLDSDVNFAWQLKAKLAYHFTESWALVLGYTAFNTTKPTLQTLPPFLTKKARRVSKNPFTNEFTLGLRWTF